MEKLINFNDLGEYNDSNSLVWTSLIMGDEDMSEMNEWFHEIGLIGSEKNLIDWKKIDGNVLGDEGRSDILLIFTEEGNFNTMVRLRIGNEVKWTSDFIHNFRKDYK